MDNLFSFFLVYYIFINMNCFYILKPTKATLPLLCNYVFPPRFPYQCQYGDKISAIFSFSNGVHQFLHFVKKSLEITSFLAAGCFEVSRLKMPANSRCFHRVHPTEMGMGCKMRNSGCVHDLLSSRISQKAAAAGEVPVSSAIDPQRSRQGSTFRAEDSASG